MSAIRRAVTVENVGDRGESLESDVKRPERRHDHKVRQDERPSARPRPPEATANVRDPDADLDRERTRQRLAYRDALAHLVLGEPPLVADQLALHLADEGDGAAEAEEAEPEVVPDELADGDALRCLAQFQC